MSEGLPTSKKEKNESVKDNARKFLVGIIDPDFLRENKATSVSLVVDWTAVCEDVEKKLVYKKFENGESQILSISKTTENGSRNAERKKITEEEYRELLNSSILRLEKKRCEFTLVQNGIIFFIKYDEFDSATICLLEVDAPDEVQKSQFNASDFPYELSEVTGDIRYYGYHIVDMI